MSRKHTMQFKRATLIAITCAATALTGSSGWALQPTTNLPTALLTFPYVAVDSANGIDTVLSVSNVSNTAISVLCLFANTNRHCSSAALVCSTDADCPPLETCDAGWAVTDFGFDLTPGQPISWRAGQGVASAPLTASHIPPTPEDPFIGSLQCYAVDSLLQQHPVERNDLLGSATIERYATAPATVLDAAKYNAVGLAAISGANNGDDVLVIGGPAAEYDPCPNVNVLNHFFEGAVDPVSKKTRIYTTLALVPCTYDRTTLTPGTADIFYLVFNEFEQRFQVKKSLASQQVGHLSDIDVVFNAGTAGSFVGQTRFRSEAGGVLGVAIEERWTKRNPQVISTAAMNLETQGVRVEADYLGAQPCGNGTIEGNEQCDDGNRTSGDGCSAACQIEPCFVCSGTPSVCGPPTSCTAAAASSLVLHDVSNPKNDHVTWSWTGTAAVADFGSPLDPMLPFETGYSLCVFDGAQLKVQATALGGACGKNACWKTIGADGFKYANGPTNEEGVTAVSLQQGTGNAHLLFKAKGTRLALPGPVSPAQYFSQAPNVTAYLVKNDGPECWQSVFPANAKNTGTDFKAVIP